MATAEATAPASEAPAKEEAAEAAQAEETKEAAPEKPKKSGMPFKYKLLLIVSSLAMMVFLRTGFIFVVVAMLPAIVAYYMDHSPRPYLFKTVFALNLSGVLPYIGRMLREGPMGSLQPIMQSIDTWIIIYGAALSGYVLVSITPILTHVFLGRFHVGQVQRIEGVLKRIEGEWGEEVTKFSKRVEEKTEE